MAIAEKPKQSKHLLNLNFIIMAFSNPIQVTHSNGFLKLHYKNSPAVEKSLNNGVELTIYRDGPTLMGELKTNTATDFNSVPVSSSILFTYDEITPQKKGDIKGGFSEEDTKVKLDDNTGNHYTDIDIAKNNDFVLGIIGVDDIRARGGGVSVLKYNQIYLMENQRIFLKTTIAPGSVQTYLEVKYKKR